MAASKFSTFPGKHRILRPSFLKSGNFFEVRDLSSLPCSSVCRFGMLDNNPLPSWKHNNLVATFNHKKGMEAKLAFGCHHFNQQVTLNRASHSCLLQCHVKSEDSEGSLSGESIILNEQTLERELQIAIQQENYAPAAQIRDHLKLLQEDSKAAVLAANARFYNSFRNGDLAAMQALWARGENVCVVHPGVSGISGYELVTASWEFVWADYEFPLNIEVKDVRVQVTGDVGYVTCVEMVKTKVSNWGRQFATNLFEKINGRWFISIHHASYVDL